MFKKLTLFQKNPLDRLNLHFVRRRPSDIFPGSQAAKHVDPSHVFDKHPLVKLIPDKDSSPLTTSIQPEIPSHLSGVLQLARLQHMLVAPIYQSHLHGSHSTEDQSISFRLWYKFSLSLSI